MNRRREDEAAARWVRSALEGGATEDDLPESWRSVWTALELPPAPAAPAGFARRVAQAWAEEQAEVSAPILGAPWMRAAAAAALIAGIALGTTLSNAGDADTAATADTAEASMLSWPAVSLSEEYLQALATPEATLEDDDSFRSNGEVPAP